MTPEALGAEAAVLLRGYSNTAFVVASYQNVK
jgi:hypothetical protein